MSRPLIHLPVRPARPTHMGETAYLEVWRATMVETWEESRRMDDDQPRAPIETILQQLPGRITQRRASVCASVAVWLGCNAGQSILYEAQRQVARGVWDKRDAYLLAWTIDNRRVGGVNSGTRSIEHVLAREEDYSPHWLMGHRVLTPPPITLDDSETIEHVLLWLPEQRGQVFLRRAAAEHDRRRDEQRRVEAAEYRRTFNIPEPT